MRKILLSVILLLTSTSAYSFWNTGHATVCKIAENKLSIEAKAEVDKLLGGMNFPESCNWPDYVRPNRDVTFPWHYVNLPKSKLKVEATDCPPEGCILEAIQLHIRLLSNKELSNEVRAESLMFLGHFLGDIHQPLHLGTKEDRGGSGHTVQIDSATEDALNYQGYNNWLQANKMQVQELAIRANKFSPHEKKSNMHSIWDGAVLQHAVIQSGLEWHEFADELSNRNMTIILGNPIMWAQESKDVLAIHSFGYNDNIESIDSEYLESHGHIVEQRLIQAGYRLATILNKILP